MNLKFIFMYVVLHQKARLLKAIFIMFSVMFKKFGWMIFISFSLSFATEKLLPLHKPVTFVNLEGALELDDDVYSSDLSLSLEYAFFSRLSLYGSTSFRFFSYSYEYSTNGYIHNYCNLHVNGFNESYLGIKLMPYSNLGMYVEWRVPPGEGSQKERFHRWNIEPFTLFEMSKSLTIGTSIQYNKFVENSNFVPGDEMGLKASFLWKIKWNYRKNIGWKFSETVLYKSRIQESKNKNIDKNCQEMRDRYSGLKMNFALARSFVLLNFPFEININYQINKGTLFGFETGHRIAMGFGNSF